MIYFPRQTRFQIKYHFPFELALKSFLRIYNRYTITLMRRTLYRLCIAFIYLFPISIRSADILKIKNRRTRTRHTGHKRQKRAVYTVKNRKRNIIEGLVFFKVEERDSLTLSACCGILYYILYIAIGYIYKKGGDSTCGH